MRNTDPILLGLHHVTAICADPQKNIDFYTGVLGLRLVKLTVNYDDPGSYHLYYGDELGRPGTIMTFFAWPDAFRGRSGPPQVTTTSFAVPMGSIDFWQSRLRERGIAATAVSERLGERVLGLNDPDGMSLEIIASGESVGPVGQPWAALGIPVQHAIRGLHGVTISEEGYEKTAKLLAEVMGFAEVASERNRFRYRAGASDNRGGNLIDLVCAPDAPHGSPGAGVVHHVAFRTPDDSQQAQWHTKIMQAGRNVSPVMDRSYFHSIYFREPGGVLFEIATNNPGFTADEPAGQLGARLQLPTWLEQHRAAIEHVLPKLRVPGAVAAK